MNDRMYTFFNEKIGNIFNLFRNGSLHQLNYNLEIEFSDCSSFRHPSITDGWDAAYEQCDTY